MCRTIFIESILNRNALGDNAEGQGASAVQRLDSAHCAASVCPYAQCLHRCMDDSECPDKNRLPGDVSPAGEHCSRPHIGQESHSSTSYHDLHSLFPKALSTSSLNLTCKRPLSCSLTGRGVLFFSLSIKLAATLRS